MAELKIGWADNNKTIALKPGDIINITLPENATTGFQWTVHSFTEDTLEQQGLERTSSPPGPPGRGSVEFMVRFRTKATGHGEVILRLSRGIGMGNSEIEFKLNLDVHQDDNNV